MDNLDVLDLKAVIAGSAVETFDTMLSMEIAPVDAEPPPGSGVHRMVGSLNFAGQITGIFTFQVTLDFGRRMAAALLGTTPDAVDPYSDVRDLIAEITNIVGGNLKSALNDAGHACILSTPSIACGTDFTIRSLSMDRFERIVFRHEGQLLVVEVGLKAQAGADGSLETGAPGTAGRLPAVDLEKLAALDYKRQLSDATIDVFDTMLSLTLHSTETVDAASLEGERGVASVCFAGEATGIVSIHVPADLIRVMAAGMLGMDPAEFEGEEEIRDFMGELGNIIGGNLKSALTDTGLRCALSTPSYTTGSDFTIESLNLERYERYAFACEGRTLFVELGIKVSDLVKAAPRAGKDIHYQVTEAEPDAPAAAPAAEEAQAAPAPPEPPPTAPLAADPPPAPPTAAPAPGLEEAAPPGATPEDLGLEILLDIPMELTVELGRTKIPIRELLRLAPGSAVKLAKLEGEPVDILANDVLIARGEVVVRREKYGIRITEITSRMERLKGLR
jgi:flagellar motor switch protein FliN